MATNGAVKFLRNMITGGTVPLLRKVLFAAGSVAVVKEGEIVECTNTGNTKFVPLDSDYDMTGTSDAVAVSASEIKASDREGYYDVIVPRPGDVFEAELATASAVAKGTALYYSTSQKLTTSAGTNIIGYACGEDHYPAEQGHVTDDASPDSGTTIRSTSYVQFTFRTAVSYYKTLEQ